MNKSCHASFEYIRSQTINSLNIEVIEYRHRQTGAQHIHIETDNNENVFLVALRTVPEDSRGVAHILEHTLLCGSEKYPVRDPFFMMIRRSLNTFMNAFTSSDWTAYPFASQNRKDFDNLLDVYLDAVFFSRLDPLDFAQEGHRLDFAETGNSDSPLVYKGVVYNEMKGAMSSITSQLWHTFNKYIYPTTTYHHNSGGSPEAIPDLTYQQLLDFYKTHYHPSNAIFMTFGNIPAIEHQTAFEERALHRFDKLDEVIEVKPEKRYFAPIRVEEAYPYQPEAGETLDNKAHIVMGWLLGRNIDLKEYLETSLLSSLLFKNSASPLQHLLETTELGASPSPLCGIENSQYEMLLMCGLADTQTAHAQAFEDAVINVLQTVVDNGLPQPEIEASLDQLELQEREISDSMYPYGLQLILNSLNAATHRGDVLAFMDLEAGLKELRQAICSPDYVPNLIKRLLLDNQHRITLVLRPESNFQAQQNDSEKMQLAAIKAALSDDEKAAIIEQAKALDERQQQKDDNSILPKVTLEDIPKERAYPTGKQKTCGHYPVHYYTAGTNGLSYQQIISPLPPLDKQLLHTLPWYTLSLTEVGIGRDDYLSVQNRQSQAVGGIQAGYFLSNNTGDPQKLFAYTGLSAKALSCNQTSMSELLRDTFSHARFDESDRLKELITQTRIAKEQNITGDGHILAMKAASANCSPVSRLNHELEGLGMLQSIKQLEQQIKEDNGKTLRDNLEQLHQKLQTTEKQWLAISEKECIEEYLDKIESVWQKELQHTPQPLLFTPKATQYKPITQAWITNSQVHFCAKAYPTVVMGHPDAVVLSVLSGVLRNGYLHRTIREQGGAYGGGATQNNCAGSFRFFSYRDPRMAETLTDFDDSIDWVINNPISKQSVEESILGVISTIDKPSSPSGEAASEFHEQLIGNTHAKREHFRQSVMQVTADDLKRVAETYLTPEKASIAIVTGIHGEQDAERLGLDTIKI